MSRRLFLCWLLLLALALSHASAEPAIRVACVGDSITFGAGIKDRAHDSYPAQLQKLLGKDYEVRNFGVSGRTMLRKGDFPYWNEKAYQQALAFQPAIVVIKLGTNDSKPQNWKFKGEFAGDTKDLIASFRNLPSHPRVLLCLPVPAFKLMWGINPEIIQNEALPILRQVAFDTRTEQVDLFTALTGKGAMFPDNIHPNPAGAGVMARVIADVIQVKADPAFDIEKFLSAQGIKSKVSSYQGYRCLDFEYAGRKCKVVQPYVTAQGHPYVWIAEFIGVLPQVDRAMLERGYHVVTCNVFGLMGGEPAMAAWEKFDALLGQAGLAKKFTLVGISRGGLYSYNWAMRHPETVACIYGDAPVCDFKSWPGGKGKSAGSKADWGYVIKYYGFKDDAEALAYKKNPVDNLKPLAQAGIPLIHVVGQADKTVPVEENTDLIEQRYKALGGTIEVIRKPGVDHHPHGLDNPEQVIDFIVKHTK